MRIVNWTNLVRSSASYQEISHVPSDDRHWTTLLIGRNGTKKSLLLRLILEGALGHSIFRHGAHPSIKPGLGLVGKYALPNRTIAIAGTPFDRFPRQTLFQRPKNPTKFDLSDQYVYLGMKSANGTMGAAHSVRTLAVLLLTGLAKETSIGSAATEILAFLGMRQHIAVEIRRHTSINVSRKDGLRDDGKRIGDLDQLKLDQRLKEIALELAEEEAPDPIIRSLVERMNSKKGQDEIAKKLSALPGKIDFSFERNTIQGTWPSGSLDAQELISLISLGLVVPNHLYVAKIDESASSLLIADSDLSSGQWHLLSSMLGLALSMEDDSLILIDEPENSLHPEWQRSYIDLLNRVLSHWRGWHAIVATHSPLIASGVRAGEGNIINLRRNADGPLGIATAAVELTYGWEASDVYHEAFGLDSTRVASFVARADRALALIRDGEDPKDELPAIAADLNRTAMSLPERDGMRSVIKAIVRVANDTGRKQ